MYIRVFIVPWQHSYGYFYGCFTCWIREVSDEWMIPDSFTAGSSLHYPHLSPCTYFALH